MLHVTSTKNSHEVVFSEYFVFSGYLIFPNFFGYLKLMEG